MTDKEFITAVVKQISEDVRLTTQWYDNFERDIDKLNPVEIADVAATALTILSEKLGGAKATEARNLSVAVSRFSDKIAFTSSKK